MLAASTTASIAKASREATAWESAAYKSEAGSETVAENNLEAAVDEEDPEEEERAEEVVA